MKEGKITQSIYEQVLDRLTHRKRLADIASGIIDTEAVNTPLLIREQDIGGVCPDTSQLGGGTMNFVCTEFSCPPDEVPAFACPGDFNCNTPQVAYGSCDGNVTIQCNQTEGEPRMFSCEQGDQTADYFDCRTFACGQEGGTHESFDCNSTVDFICGGEEYNCVEDFDCTAGHGFFCFDDHECGGKSSEDQFTCSGGTAKGCTEDGTVQSVSCTPGPISNSYGFSSGGGGGNNEPGDFLCGAIGGVDDEFDCTADFDCEAASDFSCVQTSEFTCNDFECHSSSPFGCLSSFNCVSSETFDCSKDDTAYNCANYTSSYMECKSDSEKECKSDYKCPSQNECAAPGFECTSESNMYKCSDNIPPYNQPDPFG